MATQLLMVGAKGRMGQAILALARKDKGFHIVGEVDKGDDLGGLFEKADVVVDFSHRSATEGVLDKVCAAKVAYVCGTTGQTDTDLKLIQAASKKVPLIHSPNFSVGGNLLFYLTEQAAKALPEGYDPEVIEIHHRLKKDAPSGTAKRLLEIIAQARGAKVDQVTKYGRSGEPGERTGSEIGCMRCGAVMWWGIIPFCWQERGRELNSCIERARGTCCPGCIAGGEVVGGKAGSCLSNGGCAWVELMRIGIGLGSNVGDRAKQLALARRWLRGLDIGARFSSEYETSPVDCAPGTPRFRNQVGEINWSGSLENLLQWMQEYERSCGRKTVRGKNEPRGFGFGSTLCRAELDSESKIGDSSSTNGSATFCDGAFGGTVSGS